jgi:5-methylcytosine-specific restriction endonuclease McrA
MTFDESMLNDTPETAPVMPRTQRSIDAEKARELRSSPVFKDLKAKFRADCERQRNPDGSTGAPCWLCSEDIDYKLDYPHPFSWSLDHVITVKENPALLLDIENCKPSHLDCNLGRGTDDPPLLLGVPSEVW